MLICSKVCSVHLLLTAASCELLRRQSETRRSGSAREHHHFCDPNRPGFILRGFYRSGRRKHLDPRSEILTARGAIFIQTQICQTVIIQTGYQLSYIYICVVRFMLPCGISFVCLNYLSGKEQKIL